MSCNDVLGHVAPSGNRSLAVLAGNGQGLLVLLWSVDISVDVQNNDRAQEAHALLSNSQKLGSVLVELDSLNSGVEVPGLQALSALDVP